MQRGANREATAAALVSYDPPPAVREGWQCGNLIGVVGNAFAQGAYWLFGMAAWCMPFAAVIGGLKMLAPIPKDVEEISNVRVGVRIAGLLLMALSVTGLFQLARFRRDGREDDFGHDQGEHPRSRRAGDDEHWRPRF